MRIVVISAGAVGGYFGARLALAGHEVAFVARGTHLAAMRAKGLSVKSAGRGDFAVAPVNAVETLAGAASADLVILAVKLWDTDGAIEAIRPVVGDDTVILTLQNGIESHEKLAAAFGHIRVWGGVAMISGFIERPGVLRHVGTLHKIQVGELDGRMTARVRAFGEACLAAGFEVEVSDRIVPLIWEKFIYLAALSGVNALARVAIGPMRDDPEVWSLYRDAVDEGTRLARARGIAVKPDVERAICDFVRTLPAEMKASMLIDLENGRRLELPWLSGAVVRGGRDLGVATPVHSVIFRALSPHARGRPPHAAAPLRA